MISRNWAVFSVAHLSLGQLALDAFKDKSISNLIVSNHGASTAGQSWFSKYDKASVLDVEAISSNEIKNYNQKQGKDLTEQERDVRILKSMSNKVADGGKFVFAFCYTGRGPVGKETIEELSTLFGNRITPYLPIGFAKSAY